MTTNAEIRDQLEAIDTGIYYDDKELKMDNFGSFTYCKKALPSNTDLQKILDEDSEGLHPKKLMARKIDLSFDDSFFDLDGEFNNNFMFLGINVAARSSDYTDKDGKKMKGNNLAGWKNFHDLENYQNTFKLYLQINQEKFKGCYITDLIKNSVDSLSGKVLRNFFLEDKKNNSFIHNNDEAKEERLKSYNKWFNSDDDPKYSTEELKELLKQNEIIFNKSIELFVKECNIIKPKQLVVFGNDAHTALNLVKKTQTVKENDSKKDTVNISNLIDNVLWLEHYANVKSFAKWFKEQPSEHVSK